MTSGSYVGSHTAPGKGQQYDTVYETDDWHRYLWSREQAILSRLVRELSAGRTVHALDFACGTGRICSLLESHVASLVGVDVSEPMLEVARSKVSRTTLLRGNLLEGMPLPRERFELITAFRFFVNAEPSLRQAALRALAPLLTDDGVLVFNNHQNIGSPYYRAARAYARWKGYTVPNTLSIAECRAILASAGLEIVEIHAVGMLHVPQVTLPHWLYRTADRFAEIVTALARVSESPMIVARRSPTAQAPRET